MLFVCLKMMRIKKLNELCGPEAPISGFVKVKVAYGAPKACLTKDLSKTQYRIFFHPILMCVNGTRQNAFSDFSVGLNFESF